MGTADTYVRARIDSATKERAAHALAAMGLSISDAIRLLMLRIVDERRLPFDIKVPNATTRKAIAELEAGRGKRFASTDALMADLTPRAQRQRRVTVKMQATVRKQPSQSPATAPLGPAKKLAATEKAQA